jgi:protein tyrosine phosphatase (PTP) superfamily phosphohydrolase (DUF442 family)
MRWQGVPQDEHQMIIIHLVPGRSSDAGDSATEGTGRLLRERAGRVLAHCGSGCPARPGFGQ